MKTIKHLFLLLALTTLTFYSCSDENPIENPDSSTPQESIALRTALNELKTTNNLNGRVDEFCFQFVYPITFAFNNGTTISVANFEGLIDILANESPSIYLSAIVFPFQVMQGGAITTIDNETEFTALIADCGFITYNDDWENSYCFDIVFPITAGGGGLPTTTINNVAELNAYVNANPGGNINIIYPISVTYNNQTVVINNVYEFYEMTNNCDSCPCSTDYEPVCVQTAIGTIIEFGNMCNALCAGYTQNDLVSCNPSNVCSISNLVLTPGTCNADDTYPLTIDFDYLNPGSTQFEVYSSSNVLVGIYNLADLPVTINSYIDSNFATDYVNINIVNNPNCFISATWTTPNCGNCNCPTEVNPVCVQDVNGTLIQFDNECLAACAGYTTVTSGPCPTTYNFGQLLGDCFTIDFPVSVMGGGMVVSVNSNGELLQYWQPAAGPMPMFVYPITVTFPNVTLPVTVQSQVQFESLINTHCQ